MRYVVVVKAKGVVDPILVTPHYHHMSMVNGAINLYRMMYPPQLGYNVTYRCC